MEATIPCCLPPFCFVFVLRLCFLLPPPAVPDFGLDVVPDFGLDEVLAVVVREEVERPEVVFLDAAVAFPPFAPAFAFCVFEPAEPAFDCEEVFEAVDLPPEVFAFEDEVERPEVVFDLELPPVDLAVELFDLEPPVDLLAVLLDLDAAVARPPFAPALAF